MGFITLLKEKIYAGEQITRQEAIRLQEQPLPELCRQADEIRRTFCSDGFDLCTIVNGKSGRCSEDCRFCAQSARHHTAAPEYPLLSAEALTVQARANDARGVLRYSIVTSGKRLPDREVDRMCDAVRQIRAQTGLGVCISFGLHSEAQYRKLKEAGV